MDGLGLGGAAVDEACADDFFSAYSAFANGLLRKVPASVTVEALTGALDLAATLAAGRPVHSDGLISGAKPASLLIRGADRLETHASALLAEALDASALRLVAAVDFAAEDMIVPAKLQDRLALRVQGPVVAPWERAQIITAIVVAAKIEIAIDLVQSTAEAAIAMGIGSPRAVLQTLQAARGIAALRGHKVIDDDAQALAAQLVLAHRARTLPQDSLEDDQDDSPADQSPQDRAQDPAAAAAVPPQDVILDAVRAVLPPHVLQALSSGQGRKASGRSDRNRGAKKSPAQRGRKLGSRRASVLSRQRLDVLATLRAAAPWQGLRRKLAGQNRMIVTPDDFHVARIKRRTMATAIFAVDASGSTALQRLAEAKGAVEAILAESYVRRDRVALISFRNKSAEILLPPTRSLERARRALAGLPGGGATPLALGLDQSLLVAEQVRRSGGQPVIVVLTDGRGNMTRDGVADKARAGAETLVAARQIASAGFASMVIDVSPQPQRQAKALASEMGASYLAMPQAAAGQIAQPVARALRGASG